MGFEKHRLQLRQSINSESLSLWSLVLWQWEMSERWEAKGPYVHIMIQTKMLRTSLHWWKSVIFLWTSDFPPSSRSTWCGIGTLKSSAEGVQALYLTEACAVNDSLRFGWPSQLIGCLSWLLLFKHIQLDVGISASARVLLHRSTCSPGHIFFGTKKKLRPNVLPGQTASYHLMALQTYQSFKDVVTVTNRLHLTSDSN